MKKILLSIICLTSLLISCEKELNTEQPKTVWFEAKEYTLPAAGGDIIIPVHSTGVDYASIRYTFADAWNFNDQGNMVPREGWIEIEVIPSYPASRDLMTGRSGIKLTVEPNRGTSNRTAWLLVGSYTEMASVVLNQPSSNVKSDK